MYYGVVLCSTPTAWQDAKYAEELGFDSVWYWDSPLAAGDSFVAAALTAQNVPRLRIGFAVYVPWSRSPIVTASLLGSLNLLAPGRIDICYGTGFTARRCLDLPPMKLQDIADHYRAVSLMLSGRSAPLQIDGRITEATFLHPELHNLSDAIRFHIAASGPKGRSLIAELGCGWLDAPAAFDPHTDPVFEMRRTWEIAGRKPEELNTTVLLPATAVNSLSADDNFYTARRRLAPFSMSGVHYWVDEHIIQGKELPPELPRAITDAIASYRSIIDTEYGGIIKPRQLHTGHCLFIRPEEERIVTPELLATTTISVDGEALKEKMAGLHEHGVKEVIFPILPNDVENMQALSDALGLTSPQNEVLE